MNIVIEQTYGDTMKLNRKVFINSLLIMVFVLTLSIIACASEEGTAEENDDESQGTLMTITGRVNDENQIVTEYGIYEIDFDEKGTELIEIAGRTVDATGYVIEAEGVEEDEEGESVGEVDDENEEETEDEEDEEVPIGTITVTSYKTIDFNFKKPK